MGEGAVQQVLSMIDDEQEEKEPSPLIVPTSLVVRRSTGPAMT
jgi:DNA-binding LacI/PurR family transcriptional regulator